LQAKKSLFGPDESMASKIEERLSELGLFPIPGNIQGQVGWGSEKPD